MIKAEIIEDSIAPSGIRLTTFVLTYPRFIHSEFMTHRMISKNASSSRAIPVSKFMEAIKTNPAMPISFSKNCKGMQAQEDIENQEQAQAIWLEARDQMIKYVQILTNMGVHKQHANRLLEPFTHITVVASATDWANFFALRCHKDAQPEFQALAKEMFREYTSKTPKKLKLGEWHLPFVTDEEKSVCLKSANLIKSVARCARVSYLSHDKTVPTFEQDVDLYTRLVGTSPIHASPTEHQAEAGSSDYLQSGNFRGWTQYRKTLSNENILEIQQITESE